MPRRRTWSARQRAALSTCLRTKPHCSAAQNPHSRRSDCHRVMIRRIVITFTAMTDPEPSTSVGAGPGTVRLALELLEHNLGRRRQFRRCLSVIAKNARKRGQAGRCAHHALRPSRTTPARSRSLRRFFGDIWCAGPTSRTCEQVPGPAAMPAETCSREFCTAGAVR